MEPRRSTTEYAIVFVFIRVHLFRRLRVSRHSARYPQVADQIKKFVDKGGEFAKFGVIVQQLPARPISRPSSTRLSISGARNDRAKTREYTHCHPRSGIVSIMGRTF